MYEYLIKEYIEQLKLKDIKEFAKNNGINLTNEETTIIYDYLKNHWRTIYYGNPKPILEELKERLNSQTYTKLENLYIYFKNKIS
ncbi:MAG: hypothetical protein ACOXZR_03080 [Bacilli bacterium]|jgi:hypothetical protein